MKIIGIIFLTLFIASFLAMVWFIYKSSKPQIVPAPENSIDNFVKEIKYYPLLDGKG